MIKFGNLGYNCPVDMMVIATKECLEIWQMLVHILGGELELIKSSYAKMVWKLTKGKEELTSIEESPGTLNLKSEKYKGM